MTQNTPTFLFEFKVYGFLVSVKSMGNPDDTFLGTPEAWMISINIVPVMRHNT